MYRVGRFRRSLRRSSKAPKLSLVIDSWDLFIRRYLHTRMPFVYMLRCSDGSLYTGAAKDVGRRVAEHAAGRASRYTRARRPVALVWSRRVRSWSMALKEEYRIKQLRRSAKEALAGC
jgi:putative endonuclease